MLAFGGSNICPKCSKAVYAAEQILGPGRKLYHKSCFTCTSCGRRLDSSILLEHDELPYCKTCHVKLFGTRDLRQANLPYKGTPTSSPSRPTGAQVGSAATFDSVAPQTAIGEDGPAIDASHDGVELEKANGDEGSGADAFGVLNAPPQTPPRRALYGADKTPSPFSSTTLGRSTSSVSPNSISNRATKLSPTATGTPLGVRGMGGIFGSPNGGSPGRKWTVETPKCAKCEKSVYFAEQVKAIGKIFHKGCLRCTGCNASLDPGKLTEKDGDPLCHRCYGRLHGPQGGGYALLGKAGG